MIDEGHLGAVKPSRMMIVVNTMWYSIYSYGRIQPVVMKYLEPLSRIHVPMISMQDCAVVYVKLSHPACKRCVIIDHFPCRIRRASWVRIWDQSCDRTILVCPG
jgi:hypothetical protein